MRERGGEGRGKRSSSWSPRPFKEREKGKLPQILPQKYEKGKISFERG